MRRLIAPAALLLVAAAPIRSDPSLGVAEGRCRPNESGPAILITAEGLKDRRGLLRAELYPPDDADFLGDDNKLVAAGKTFRRAEIAVPESGPVRLCIRAPAPGLYTLALIHDRDANHKFGLLHDGVGFPGNPHLSLAKPKADEALVRVGSGVLDLSIILNYYRGLFSFGPLRDRQ